MNWVGSAVITITLILMLPGCQSLQSKSERAAEQLARAANPFVTVSGNHFFRQGKPYYYVGTNFWYGAYLGATEDGRERLVRELDKLQEIGINNLRVLAVSEQTDLLMAVNPGIQISPGILNEDLLVGLDVLLDEMAKRDMVAVLYLNNFWQWSGGMAQYMAWLSGLPAFDPDATGDWSGFMQNSAKFYRSEQAQQWYQNVIAQIVRRKNTVNGKAYVEDPAIMAWQLANEPRPGSEEGGRPFFADYKTWIESTAALIKTLDSKHLVSTGSEGAMGTLGDIGLYQQAHISKDIDYVTMHLWPKNWSWLDIHDLDSSYPIAVAKSKAYILRHIEVAESLSKPIVLEEFGIERDQGAFDVASPTSVRDRFFVEIFSLIESQAKLGKAIAGSNFWAWGGFGAAAHADYRWYAGDLFTGDPPQEPQGLNSVFASDATTLDIIKAHAWILNGL